jgi:hypothetical protein
MRAAGLAFAMAVLFGFVFLMADMADHSMLHYDSETPRWWFTAFYYSIVTYTTLGFGDVTPASFDGELWVGAEVLSGYLMLGLLVSILANKVARRA